MIERYVTDVLSNVQHRDQHLCLALIGLRSTYASSHWWVRHPAKGREDCVCAKELALDGLFKAGREM